jgi:hypothetical protein
MKSKPNDYRTWESQMTPEAIGKASQIVAGWNNGDDPKDAALELLKYQSDIMASLSHPSGGIKGADGLRGWSRGELPPTIKAQYIGETVRTLKESRQILDLDVYINDLTDFDIVKSIYVLDDEREEGGDVSILIKLHELSNVSAHALEKENEMLTNYLIHTKVRGAERVFVSFQYMEVY